MTPHRQISRGTNLSGKIHFATMLIFLIGLAPTSKSDEIDFDKQIRPILSDNCFHCHGPDAATREADLRLDTKDGAFADLGGYAAFRSGDEEGSEALRRIFSGDADEVMPPPGSKLKLSGAEKTLLKSWVNQGARWSEHWAFVKPTKPAIPEPVSSENLSDWSRSPIDRFIAARAIENGLKLGESATKETLIRRVTLDLTGLPPTPEEIDAFLSDESDDAYEKLVDRLLSSNRYGERMAWPWLDAARYADTDGFQGDPTRTMWPWRDWLVRALNENMPFDQFTIEMLAGDLLPDATAEQILATGFNRNHMFNGEGGRIPEETRVENVFDRAETTGTVWMGLTLTCCRCHDHKYDAIGNKEYFQMYAFFNNTSENGRSGRGRTAPIIQYLDIESTKRVAEITESIGEFEARLHAPNKELDNGQAEWESEVREKLNTAGAPASLGAWWKLGPIPMDGRKAFDEKLAPEQSLDLKATVNEKKWAEAKDVKDAAVYPLDETVGATFFYRKIKCDGPRTMRMSFGSDDAIKVYVNGKEVLANFAARAANPDQEKTDVDLIAGENELLIKIVNTGGIGGFYFNRLSESVLGFPMDVVAALRADPSKRQSDQQKILRQHYRSKNWPEWAQLSKQRDVLAKERDQINKRSVAVMVMDQLPKDKTRKTLILERGGYDKPTDVSVTPNTPAVLPPLQVDSEADRLDLARWLVDPSHPLTARVTVNRYWQMFFGRGIVKSTEDFGIQGNRPTHPELLDYLAVKFIESGWNVKELHKEIVMSTTYRQSSRVTPQALESDPDNVWLARAPRFRFPSWMLRDQALAMGGLLSPKIGGPPVKPYQPDGVWAEATFGKIKYQRDSGESLYRRSLYVFWRRIVGPTMFFDGAKRQTCEVKPARTNTPLHALTTLNETTFVESARAMAERVMSAESSKEKRLQLAFRIATGRRATAGELLVMSIRIDLLVKDFSANSDDAKKWLAVGEHPRNEKLPLAEHAAYTMVCSMMMNLDESLTRH